MIGRPPRQRSGSLTVGLGMGALATLVKNPGDDEVRRNYRSVVLDFIVRFAHRQ